MLDRQANYSASLGPIFGLDDNNNNNNDDDDPPFLKNE
jgi:hypothetical protein